METQITLPLDAEGKEIPLDTKVLYFKDGSEHRVAKWVLYPYGGTRWAVVFDNEVRRYPDVLYLTQPDNWKRLLDDIDRAIHTPDPDTYASITCGYFDSANMGCAECERKHHICRETCNDAAWVDIAARIRRLSGDGE